MHVSKISGWNFEADCFQRFPFACKKPNSELATLETNHTKSSENTAKKYF